MKTTILSFPEITDRIRELRFPTLDLVVGIASGGIIPASLIAFHLKKPLKILEINYRDEDNNPRYEEPKILSVFDEEIIDKKVLLVDDVSVTGKTLRTAERMLSNCSLTTFVLKGQADIAAFPDIATCVIWPWKARNAAVFEHE